MNQKTKVSKDLEQKTLSIERSFATTKEKLWQVYTDKALFEAWWGPEGWETTTKEFDFRPGGRIHYGMKCVDPNQTEWFGKQSWGVMEIETIDDQHMFVARDFFCDADGSLTPGMPSQKFIVELVEENGQIRLINRSLVDSAEQLEVLMKMGMVEGFDSQLNKLEALLVK